MAFSHHSPYVFLQAVMSYLRFVFTFCASLFRRRDTTTDIEHGKSVPSSLRHLCQQPNDVPANLSMPSQPPESNPVSFSGHYCRVGDSGSYVRVWRSCTRWCLRDDRYGKFKYVPGIQHLYHFASWHFHGPVLCNHDQRCVNSYCSILIEVTCLLRAPW